MPVTVTSPNMNIVLPVNGITTTPTWGAILQSALQSTVDAHDHSSGKGVQIKPTGLNINSDLPFGSNNATALRTTRFTPQGAPLSGAGADIGAVYVAGQDLYYNDTAGNTIQVTKLGAVNGGGGGASTQISASFVQPNVGSTVAVQMVNTAALSAGASVTVAGGGYYICTIVTDSTHATLLNTGSQVNAGSGSNIGSGAVVQVAGQGAQLSATAPAEGQALVLTGGAYTPAGLKQVFNVRSYGAKGDGLTDDYTAITSAITAASTTGQPTVVFFPATTSNVYVVTKPLRVAAHNITFEGAHAAVTIQSGSNANANSYPVAYIGADLGNPILSANLSPSGTTGYRTRGAFTTGFVTATNSFTNINQGLTIDLGFSSANGYWNFSGLGAAAPLTTTNGTFTQPAQFGTTTVPVTSTVGISPGGIVTIPDSGRWNVSSVNPGVSFTGSLANGYPGIAQGSTIASGKNVFAAVGNGSNGLTVRCKIDPVANLATNDTRTVVSVSGRTRNSAPSPARNSISWAMHLFGTAGKNVVQFVMQVASGTTYTATGAINVPAGSLTEIAVVYNGTDIRIFVGGVLDTTLGATGAILQTSYQSFYLGYVFGQILSKIIDSGYGYEIAELWVHQTPAYQAGYTPTTTAAASAMFQEFLLSFDPQFIPAGYPGWVIAQPALNGTRQPVWLPWDPNNNNAILRFQAKTLTFNNANTWSVLANSTLLMRFDRVTFSGACGPLFRNYSYSIVLDQCNVTGGTSFSNVYSTALLISTGAQFLDIRAITIGAGFIHSVMALGSSLRIRGAYIECGKKTVILAQGTNDVDIDGIALFDDAGVSSADYAFTIETCKRFSLRGEAIGYTPAGSGRVYAFDAVQAAVVDITQTAGANEFFHNSPGQSLYPIEFTRLGEGVPMQPADGAGIQTPLVIRGRQDRIETINFTSDANLVLTNNVAISAGCIQFTDTGSVLTLGRNISGLPLVPGYLYTIINDTAKTLTLIGFSGATSVAITAGSVVRVRSKWVAIAGTVAATANGVLTGTGTSFTTALQNGGLVTFDPTGTLIYAVASITNNTSADLQEAISGGIPGGSKMYVPVYVAN